MRSLFLAQISSKSQFLIRNPPFHLGIRDRGVDSRLRVLRIRPDANDRSSTPVRRLVSSLQFANTSASQNQNRRWTLHARVASIVSTSPQAVISPEMPACSHVAVPPRKPASPHCQAGYDSMGLSYEKPRRPFRCCQVLGTSLPNGKRVHCPRCISCITIAIGCRMDNALRLPCRAQVGLNPPTSEPSPRTPLRLPPDCLLRTHSRNHVLAN